jgi:WD40 repeat protein
MRYTNIVSLVVVSIFFASIYGCNKNDKEIMPLKTFTSDNYPARYALLTSDNKHIISAGCDKKIKITEIETGNIISSIDGSHECINTLAISDDGLLLASGGGDQSVRNSSELNFISLKENSIIANNRSNNGEIYSIVFSGNRDHLLSGYSNGLVTVWDKFQKEHNITQINSEIYSICTIPVSKLFATGDGDGNIILWNYETKKKTRELKGELESVFCLASLEKGSLLSSGGFEKIEIWSTSDFKKIGLFEVDKNTSVISLSFHDSGNYLIAGLTSGKIALINLKTSKIKYYNAHSNKINSISFSKDGQYILSASEDRTIKIWATNQILSL